MSYHPMVANTDYSPTSEPMLYIEPLDDYSGGYPYNEPDFGMIDTLSTSNIRNSSNAVPTSPDGWSSFNTTPFGGIGDICTAFNTAETGGMPAFRHLSLPPSNRVSPSSESLSPSIREQESPCSETTYHISEEEVVIPRKRGRPRLNRNIITEGDSSTQMRDNRRTTCLPHKQVERKYREGLNMEFERLRRAIPTLPQSIDANVMGASKPSKGMVLGAAIAYINKIERERDAAMNEIERLGGTVRMSRLEKSWSGINKV